MGAPKEGKRKGIVTLAVHATLAGPSGRSAERSCCRDVAPSKPRRALQEAAKHRRHSFQCSDPSSAPDESRARAIAGDAAK
jgi:hypothetical protein